MSRKTSILVIVILAVLIIIAGALLWLQVSKHHLLYPPAVPAPTIPGPQYGFLAPAVAKLCANPVVYTSIATAMQDPSTVCNLNLFGDHLTQVPAAVFTDFPHLVQLNLAENQLTSVPPQIGNLTYLSVLYLGNNQLTQLPPQIGNLSNLTMLSLFVNQLTNLPSSMSNLKSLRELYLTGNPIPVATQQSIASMLPGVPIQF